MTKRTWLEWGDVQFNLAHATSVDRWCKDKRVGMRIRFLRPHDDLQMSAAIHDNSEEAKQIHRLIAKVDAWLFDRRIEGPYGDPDPNPRC